MTENKKRSEIKLGSVVAINMKGQTSGCIVTKEFFTHGFWCENRFRSDHWSENNWLVEKLYCVLERLHGVVNDIVVEKIDHVCGCDHITHKTTIETIKDLMIKETSQGEDLVIVCKKDLHMKKECRCDSFYYRITLSYANALSTETPCILLIFTPSMVSPEIRFKMLLVHKTIKSLPKEGLGKIVCTSPQDAVFVCKPFTSMSSSLCRLYETMNKDLIAESCSETPLNVFRQKIVDKKYNGYRSKPYNHIDAAIKDHMYQVKNVKQIVPAEDSIEPNKHRYLARRRKKIPCSII